MVTAGWSFDYEADNWKSYKELLEQLFMVNEHDGSGADDAQKQQCVLLTNCGKKPYKLVTLLAALDNQT